jgi:hypothetical protein
MVKKDPVTLFLSPELKALPATKIQFKSRYVDRDLYLRIFERFKKKLSCRPLVSGRHDVGVFIKFTLQINLLSTSDLYPRLVIICS